MATKATNKINVFAKAATKAATVDTGKKGKETVWEISPQITADAPTREQLNDAVTQLHVLNAQRKTVETKEKAFKSILNAYAGERYVESVAATGVEPPSPLKVVNEQGQSVTYVVQDRGHLTKVTDEQYDALAAIVGTDAMDKLVYTGGDFKFDSNIMAQPALGDQNGEQRTVQDVVGEALGELLEKLVTQGKLRPEQAEGLLSYVPERRFKPGLTKLMVEVCGRNAMKLAKFLSVLGSAVVRYVRV